MSVDDKIKEELEKTDQTEEVAEPDYSNEQWEVTITEGDAKLEKEFNEENGS